MRIASLNYLKNFKCLAERCEANCCQGWEIRVDAETYLRCADAADEGLRKLFLSSFVAEEAQSVTPAVAGRFKLKNGNCSLLDENKLCALHKDHGPAYLPCICHRYPREENIVGDLRERSATISCPEIARLALLSAQALSFELEGQPDQWPHLMHRTLEFESKNGPSAYKSSFHQVREAVLDLLQNGALTLDVRLWWLGRLCESLALLIEQKNFSSIGPEMRDFKAAPPGWFEARKSALSDAALAKVIRALCDYELVEKIHFPQYQHLLCEVRDAFAAKLCLPDKQLTAFFRSSEKSELAGFHKRYRRFLENYLVNLVLKQLFPFEEERAVLEQYDELLLQYAIARVHLTAPALLDGGMSEEKAIAVMHTFARTWDANAAYRRALRAGFVRGASEQAAK